MSEDPKKFQGSEFIGYAPRSSPDGSASTSALFDEKEAALLGVAGLGIALTTADIFFTLVSLPAVQRGLGSSDQALQFAVALHSAAFASVLIAAGRLGDHIGAHRVYMLGLVLMIIGSALASTAPNTTVFLAARGIQGIASGFIAPQIVALLGTHFQGDKRRKAFAAFALAQAFGGVMGQLSAGLIIEANLFGYGWRGTFALVCPVALICLLLTARYASDLRDSHRRPLDAFGAILCAAFLGLTTWSLTIGRDAGGPIGLGAGLIGATFIALILGIQQRRLSRSGGYPMLPLELLATPRVRLGLLATFVFYAGVLSFYWLVGIHSQRDLGLSPWEAGCLFSMCGFGFAISTALGPRISASTQRRTLYWGALGLAGAHLLGLVISLTDKNVFGTAIYVFLAGFSIGSIMAPLLATVTSEAHHEDAGSLAGVFGSIQASGNGLGAVVIPIAYLSTDIETLTGLGLGGYAASLLLLLFLAVTLAAMIKKLLKSRRATRAIALRSP